MVNKIIDSSNSDRNECLRSYYAEIDKVFHQKNAFEDLTVYISYGIPNVSGVLLYSDQDEGL